MLPIFSAAWYKKQMKEHVCRIRLKGRIKYVLFSRKKRPQSYIRLSDAALGLSLFFVLILIFNKIVSFY